MEKDQQAHDKILDIVVEKDEVTWKSMIQKLVKEENMNPWDIDVSRLADSYSKMLRNIKTLDFRVTGNVYLAAATLLRMKSQKLLSEEMGELDRLMAPEPEITEESFYEELEFEDNPPEQEEPPFLMPRTPQPRKRKVSIYDLMSALDKALEVRDRRILRNIPTVKIEIPEKKLDMSKLISTVHSKIETHFSSEKKLVFSQLVDGIEKKKKMHHFLALLHLSNVGQRKVDLVQKEHFGEIEITIPKKN